MKKSLTLIFLLCSIVSFAQNTTGTITDTRDGKVYKTVVIGSQTWMSENLNVSTFRNGDPIMESKTNEEWEQAGKNKQPAWCYYDNNPQNEAKFGKLYNWYAATDSRGLAPAGLHVPTDEEWTILSDFLGGENTAGKKMKNTSEWIENGNGTNTSGFSGLPGGNRIWSGGFINKDRGAQWWSSDGGNEEAGSLAIGCFSDEVILMGEYSEVGLSVRCVKD